MSDLKNDTPPSSSLSLSLCQIFIFSLSSLPFTLLSSFILHYIAPISPPINPSIHPSIHHPSIHPSIHPFPLLSVFQFSQHALLDPKPRRQGVRPLRCVCVRVCVCLCVCPLLTYHIPLGSRGMLTVCNESRHPPPYLPSPLPRASPNESRPNLSFQSPS